MAVPLDLQGRIANAYKETSTTGQAGLVVINADGSATGAGGKYNVTLPTYTDGQTVIAQFDSSGRQIVSLGTRIAGEDLTNDVMKVEQRFSFTNITTQTTTTVKSGAGFLYGIAINTPVASAVSTIYDNTAGSGTVIATITMPAALLSSGPVFIPYNASFSTGLTDVTSGANQNITLLYR